MHGSPLIKQKKLWIIIIFLLYCYPANLREDDTYTYNLDLASDSDLRHKSWDVLALNLCSSTKN